MGMLFISVNMVKEFKEEAKILGIICIYDKLNVSVWNKNRIWFKFKIPGGHFGIDIDTCIYLAYLALYI